MCGITGFLTATWPAHGEQLLERMAGCIAHRGPDAAGVWADAEAGIGFAHRRLSIIDLSAAGCQPMSSPGGRFTLIFNGEIYNYAELRRDLEATGRIAWRGHSDTEVLVVGFERWGIEATIRRTVGMFALAVWDRQTRRLSLARDRIGEKPLYCGWQGSTFLFGSELKSLKAHPSFLGEIDRSALAGLLRYNYIPTPGTIYQGMAKMRPGTIVEVSLAQRTPETRQYWSAAETIAAATAAPFAGDEKEAVEQLDRRLREAVSLQMVADVPLGAFLSGGIDSSTIVALMQAQSPRPIKTFSIGFREAAFDEATHAREVARHLGTDHTELYVTADEAMAVIPRLPEMYCEPFADSSQIPTFMVAQLARRHVTVSLSGDAGDELFSGYNRYLFTQKLWHRLAPFPVTARRAVAAAIRGIPPAAWSELGNLGARLSGRAGRRNLGDLLHKGAGVLTASDLDDLYRRLISHREDPTALLLGEVQEPPLPALPRAIEHLEGVPRMMALDLLTYLPDDILVKVDRATMAVSLESRIPLLDHRVVEFAWRLPQSMKLREGVTKWALRQVLYRYVPKPLIERPKMGFGLPIGTWLRGPLRDWAESLLAEPKLRQEGFFHAEKVRRLWTEHVSGRRNWAYQIWNVLMFQAWLEREKR